jgi:heme/copper-type cytochrome/quinol oxidase subunit 2
VTKGTPVELQITGISGDRHPFEIEGLGIKGEVLKGKTTVVRFTPKEAGTYAIRCLTHADMRSGGPMVGYIFVH